MRPATLLALGLLFPGLLIDPASARGQEPVTEPEAVFSDRILVQLFTIKIRALDHLGAPLSDLDVDDLRVRVGRKEVPIVAIDWIPGGPAAVFAPLGGESPGVYETAIVPRLVVFFVQTSVLAHRAVGLRWLLRRIDRVLDALHPSDRVAVVSFHHHLEFRSDFTRDRNRVVAALEEAILFRPSRLQAAAGPSLAAVFDAERAFDAAFVEQGLEVVADSLAQLPGEKIMFFLGWGLGVEHGGRPTHNFLSATAALYRAGVTVSSLAVGNLMDRTTSNLDRSVRMIAAATGGTYVKLHPFIDLAVERLSRSLDGHYLLTFEVPAGAIGGPVTVEMRKGPYRVHYPPLVLKSGAIDGTKQQPEFRTGE